MSSNEKLMGRAKAAAATYLERIGYELLESDWECPGGTIDLIARDVNGNLVFADVQADTQFPASTDYSNERVRFERIAFAYLADYEETNISVRYDVIHMAIISEDRAFVRHYQNALNAA